VVIEMGGTPLSEFDHPRNAIYILGSEDHGVPKNVLRACREVVSLEAQEYASYNVAVAGSIVMYDRLIKMRKFNSSQDNRRSDDKK
jgi:tRNA G18 (ribose-2'-O)-methylase SpoU